MDDQVSFRVLLALLFIGFVVHRGYYHRKHARPPEGAREAGSGVANLLAIPALLSAAAFVIRPAWMTWGSLAFPAWLRWAGAGVALLGFLLLEWSQRALGENWSENPAWREGQQLVTSGPYRWMRHPIYSAFLLILSSPLLISANWFIGGLWIGVTAVDVFQRIRAEEALLLSRFGEKYGAYARRTGRLLPRIGGPDRDRG